MAGKPDAILSQWIALDPRFGVVGCCPDGIFDPSELTHPLMPKGIRIRPNKTEPASIIWRGFNPPTSSKTALTLGSVASISPGQVYAEVERIRERQRLGLHVRSAVMTVSESFDGKYLPHIQLTLASWQDHLSRFNRHIRKVLGHRPLHQVSLAELIQLVDQLQPVPDSSRKPETLAPATRNRIIDLLKAFFSHLVKIGLLEKSPASRLQKLPEMNARQRVLSEDELMRLGRALMDATRPVDCLVRLALATGLRLGEMLNARFSHVDFEHATLLLQKNKSQRTRLVALSPEAMAVVQELRRHARNDYLFPAARGEGPMARPTKAFNKVLAAAGIDNLTIHDLRRVHGSVAAQGSDVAILDVSRHLGHSAVAVTERAYLVACDHRVRRATTLASREIYRRLTRGILMPTCASSHRISAARFVMAR